MQGCKAIGYSHRSVLRPDEKVPLPSREQRIRIAREASLPLLADAFHRRPVVEASVPRIAAAKGFIASGIESADEINEVTATYRNEGVIHDHELVPLVWGRMPDTGRLGITTGLHIDREAEFVRIARAAHADRSSAIPSEVLERAILDSKLDFSSEHGHDDPKSDNPAVGHQRVAGGDSMAFAGKARRHPDD